MDVYQRRRLVAVLATVLVLVLVVVAVAGGGDDEEAPIEPVSGASTPGLATSLSKSEFISQGDAICEEAAAAIANIQDDDPAERAAQELELTESQLDQLRSLTPPEEDQSALDDFFASMEELIAALEKQFLATDRNDETALAESSTEIDAAKSDARAAADDYGFKECGEDGEPSTDSEAIEATGEAVAPAATPPVAPPAPAAPPAGATTAPAPPAPPPSDGGGGGGGTGGVSP